MSAKIAYIMSRFPHLPETFILREMTELENNGRQIALYPLILQQQSVVHAEAQSWLPRARAYPFLSPEIIGENARQLFRRPLQYGNLWRRVLWENRSSPNFFARAIALLPKSVLMARQMQSDGVQHIHAHYATHPALVAWLIHQLNGVTYSVTVHAHDIFVRTAMLSAKMRDASFIIAISEYNREYLARVVGPWVREKIHVVHCGVRPEDYTPRLKRQRVEHLEILNIGSLQPYKGQKYLIEACALLKERGIKFRCRIVGSGEEKEPLQNLIEQRKLTDEVFLLGAKTQTEVAVLLHETDCYVQPSVVTASGKKEGIPVALMEALACAIPSVATSISGVPELVRPNETGYLVEPENSQALADVLQRIDQQPEEAERFGANGLALVLKEFDLRKNVKELNHLFTGLLDA